MSLNERIMDHCSVEKTTRWKAEDIPKSIAWFRLQCPRVLVPWREEWWGLWEMGKKNGDQFDDE